MEPLTSLLPYAAALLGTGIAAGLLAGLLGVGGGIVIVPVLFNLFILLDIDPAVRMHLAVGTSLATIIPTSIVSARSHGRKGAVDPALLKSWGPAILLGTLIGTGLAAFLDGRVLTGVFGVVALIVALNMGFGRRDRHLARALPREPARAALGATVGMFSALMGIGGGTLSVPLLTLFNYPIHRAVGTAAAIGLIIAIPGSLGYVIGGWQASGLPPYSLGHVSLIGFALIVPTTMLCAPLGVRLAHILSPNGLRKAFAVFLGLTALRMLSSIWS